MARSTEVSKSKALRCAIYTRKSSEEGLEQDFNSLHAQRESCEAYIKSQRHEGWVVVSTHYNDGGYSGGSMERPALTKLLADIQSGLVDVVVVYKVDRLTRSLTDFAKIVEIFDKAGASFVSVTQQFNTTTSMGRLTLNVLLSFAQFEREVTGERIRDKIAASKQKGMWMGGLVPLGYDRKDRTLVANKTEAKTVQTIFELFLKLKNIQKLQAELIRKKLKTKRYPVPSGRLIGGLPFYRGHLYRILTNPLYLGEIVHKGTRHPGQHPAIIDQETWDAVQALLDQNRHVDRTNTNAKSPSLLAGLIYDQDGNRLVSSHTNKSGKRYRYYMTSQGSGRDLARTTQPKLRLPAADVDAAVISALLGFLTDQKKLADHLKGYALKSGALAAALSSAQKLATKLRSAPTIDHREIVVAIIERVDASAIGIGLVVCSKRLKRELGLGKITGSDNTANIQINVALKIATKADSPKLVINGTVEDKPNRVEITAIARGLCWFEELTSGRVKSFRQIAKREGVTATYISRLIEQALISSLVGRTAVRRTNQ